MVMVECLYATKLIFFFVTLNNNLNEAIVSKKIIKRNKITLIFSLCYCTKSLHSAVVAHGDHRAGTSH